MRAEAFSIAPQSLIHGRYEVIRCIGVGSVGVIYSVRDQMADGRTLSLKILHPEVASDETCMRRFYKEITAAYGINHPHVVRAYDYFRDGDLVGYAMEYVDGGDLSKRLQSKEALPIDEALILLEQILSGLQAIHGVGIVHRDVKPENILLTQSGQIKITDFGSIRTENGPKLTEHSSLLGTIDYISPEYLEHGHLDSRTDIYAVGVIAYQMLTGQIPFQGETVVEIMTSRVLNDPKPPSILCPDCPPTLERIILKALAKNPEERFQSAQAMLDEIKGLKERRYQVQEIEKPAPQPAERPSDAFSRVVSESPSSAIDSPVALAPRRTNSLSDHPYHGPEIASNVFVFDRKIKASPPVRVHTPFMDKPIQFTSLVTTIFCWGAIIALGSGFAIMVAMQKIFN